jgi:large-conductance mechanosensitive channel
MSEYIKQIILSLVYAIKTNSLELQNFIKQRQLTNVALGILVGVQVNSFCNSLTNNIIVPIVDSLNFVNDTKIENITYDIFGINIKIGNLIISVLKLALTILIIYILWIIISKFDETKFIRSLSIFEKFINTHM